MNAGQLISSLEGYVRQHQDDVQGFQKLTDAQLNQKANPERWSLLECIEHLNRYGDYYLPAIEKALNQSSYPPSVNFRPGLMGNYFAKSMLPKEKLNKTKTFSNMNPINSALDRSVLQRFLDQQETMLRLLNRAKETNLTWVKVPISIARWIRFRLGDVFRVVIFHNIRHFEQAKQASSSQTV